MNILIHNPIADMYGPEFLGFYGAVIAATLVGVFCLLSRDTTSKLPTPLIPEQPDPYEIAYLRGDETEALELIGWTLLRQGYLVEENKDIKQAVTPPDTSPLKPLERAVFDWFSSAKKGGDMSRDLALQIKVRQEYHSRLEKEQLLHSKATQPLSLKLKWSAIASGIILGLGGYKFIIAISRGHHNVGFLMAMAFFSLFILWVMVEQRKTGLTVRGQNYLRHLKQAFTGLEVETDRAPESDYNTMLAIAVFGWGYLPETLFQNYSTLFSRFSVYSRSTRRGISSSSSSSCSSCGSSCGGGGGCGGGCGGCGGG